MRTKEQYLALYVQRHSTIAKVYEPNDTDHKAAQLAADYSEVELRRAAVMRADANREDLSKKASAKK